jgi:hypothetical protein
MYNTLWYLGSIIAAWTVFGTLKYNSDAAWRIPVGMQAAMPLIQFLGIWLLPESPRWLCAKDRGDEAFQVLVKVIFADIIKPSTQSNTYSTMETGTELITSAHGSFMRYKKPFDWKKKTRPTVGKYWFRLKVIADDCF